MVLEALRERSTVQELARKYELTPNLITNWKKSFLENAAAVFDGETTRSDEAKDRDEETQKLYAQIGQQKVEIDWLKKKLL